MLIFDLEKMSILDLTEASSASVQLTGSKFKLTAVSTDFFRENHAAFFQALARPPY